MKMFVRIGVLWALVLAMALSATAQVNVTQFHNHYTRDGLYVDSHFTTAAAAGLTRDLNFNGTISGSVRAQPLYISGGPGGVPMIIAVTESDNVYALNATNGNVIWHDSVGTGVTSGLQCSDSINPLGITGTPAVDLASRSLFFNAMSSAGGTIKHLIFSLNVDTGATNSGWPVDVGATAAFGGNSFLAVAQTQLSACTVLNGYVCVAYCGCGDAPATYRGWIVGVQISNPANVQAWDVGSRGGGSWGVGGVASDDGTNAFIATGNTYNPGSWTGGEAIIRFQPGPVFSGLTNDYWVPTNWQALDTADLDLASSGPLMLDVPGATPSQLVVALGKDGNGYLINRTNMGGITAPVAQKTLSLANIDQAAATYRTAQGTYFVCNVSTTSSSISSQTQLLGVRVSAANPPAMSTIWTNSQGGRASPFVTSTDGTNNIVVWGLGAIGDERLHAFDPDTGATVFSGGGANELMSGVEKWNSAIAANGRIYVAADNKVYAFKAAATAAGLVFSTPPANTSAGKEIGGAGVGFTVQLVDIDGNNITGAGTNITISLASGTGSLLGTLTVATGAGGSSTFNVTNNTPGAKTITASAGGMSPITSPSFNINAGSSAQLVFVQLPSPVTSSNAISPSVTIQVQDAFGNNVASNGVLVSISLIDGAAVLSGTTNALSDATGLAAFTNLVLTGNSLVTLQAAGTGMASATGQTFVSMAGMNIPTVTEWGFIILVILQLVVGVRFLVRRNRAVPAPARV